MCLKAYAYPPKRRTTKENANVWTDTLQVTEYKCIERQEKMNCGTGLQMAAKPDRSIVIQTKVRFAWRSLERVEAGLQSVRRAYCIQDYCVTGRHILQMRAAEMTDATSGRLSSEPLRRACPVASIK
jgi:hypothetical protein